MLGGITLLLYLFLHDSAKTIKPVRYALKSIAVITIITFLTLFHIGHKEVTFTHATVETQNVLGLANDEIRMYGKNMETVTATVGSEHIRELEESDKETATARIGRNIFGYYDVDDIRTGNNERTIFGSYDTEENGKD